MESLELRSVLARAQDRRRTQPGVESRHWLIYGAGRIGRKWAAVLAGSGRTVHGFIDRQAIGTPDQPVYRVTECPPALKQKCSVLLALHNPGVDVAAVRASLEQVGFCDLWLLQDLVDVWPEQSHFWLASSQESLPYVDDIAAAHDALADASSCELFCALLDQRLNGAAERLPAPDPSHHYLPQDLPTPRSPLRFIDCGAYVGDTIESFRQNDLRFAEIAAFEPDPNHFPKLAAAMASEKAALFPCGVWDSMTQLRFSSDDSASHITDSGEIIVQTVALDQAIPRFAPDYIKMDIEGAEGHALQGAVSLISTYRPRLAISTYHKPRDLWELLLQVQRMGLGYRFHLRSHAFNGFETVLYALPTP